MKLTTIEVKGRKFDIEVGEDGKFHSLFEHDQVTAPSLEDLRTALTRRMSTAAVKLNIQFLRFRNGKICKGTLTGIHASNRNVLVTWEGGEKSQESAWSSDIYIRPDNIAEYEQLSKIEDEARAALAAFIKTNRFDAKAEIKKLLAGTDAEAAA